MKYTIEIPDGLYCNDKEDCPLFHSEDLCGESVGYCGICAGELKRCRIERIEVGELYFKFDGCPSVDRRGPEAGRSRNGE